LVWINVSENGFPLISFWSGEFNNRSAGRFRSIDRCVWPLVQQELGSIDVVGLRVSEQNRSERFVQIPNGFHESGRLWQNKLRVYNDDHIIELDDIAIYVKGAWMRAMPGDSHWFLNE
jgi:hypothetical protein